MFPDVFVTYLPGRSWVERITDDLHRHLAFAISIVSRDHHHLIAKYCDLAPRNAHRLVSTMLQRNLVDGYRALGNETKVLDWPED